MSKKKAGISSINSNKLIWYLINIFGVICILSIIYFVALTSLRPRELVYKYPPSLFPWPLTVEHYIEILLSKGLKYTTYLINSFIISALTVILTLTIGSLAAYPLATRKFRGDSALFLLFLVPMMVPYQAILVPLYIEMDQLGLLNTYVGLSFVHLTLNLPISILIIRAAFRAIPKDIQSAALIDGCSYLRTFWSIYLPLAKHGIMTILIFVFFWSWSDFLVALVFMTEAKKYTFPVGLYQCLNYMQGLRWDLVCAFAMAGSIPVMVLFAFTQRYFKRGIFSGSF